MPSDADAMLRRLQITAAAGCAALSGAALLVSRSDPRPVTDVDVSALDERLARPAGAPASPPPRVGKTAVLVAFRYALLALLAYVMIARLRLHPLGLLAGASSVVAAAAIEAGRLLSKKQ